MGRGPQEYVTYEFVPTSPAVPLMSGLIVFVMGSKWLICLLSAHLLQCLSSLSLHPGSGLWLSCFYITSLWLQRFLWVGRRWVVFAPYSPCVWNQRPWRSRRIILLSLGFFFCTYTCKDSTDSQNLWCRGSISPKVVLVLPKYFLNCISWPTL